MRNTASGCFLLFFAQHAVIYWSHDQKFSNYFVVVCMGQCVLQKTAGHSHWGEEEGKHCLLVGLLVAQGFDTSVSTNTVAFYDRTYPQPRPFLHVSSRTSDRCCWKGYRHYAAEHGIKNKTIPSGTDKHRCFVDIV